MIREELVDICVSLFDVQIRLENIKNQNFILTDNKIEELLDITIRQIQTMNINIASKELLPTEDERNLIIRKIKSIYVIFQEEGDVILGDYNHDYGWYDRLLQDSTFEQYYWNRYKHYLKNKKDPLPPSIIAVLENNTLKNIMSWLGNPRENQTHFSVRGLVVGDVQSGKTSNYIGLIAKAADAGYKVIFVLTGTIESLRRQTQARIEEGFIGYNSVTGEDVGVNRGEKTPKAFTSRNKDFTGHADQNTTYRLSDYSTEPMIFVLKKNKSVLQKVFSSLKTINTTAQHQKIDYPALIIDDEADNASVNTNLLDGEHDPTVINMLIRNILSLFTRSSYVGFTATPFANVFISYDDTDEMLKDDLFPRDFIYALYPPSNYCGARKYFFNENNNVEFITDDDQEIFPINHKKDWEGDELYGSVYYAVNCFLLTNAIRDILDASKETHRSMLINISRFTRVQIVIQEIIEKYVKDVVRTVKQCHKLAPSQYASNPIIQSLKECYDAEFSNIYINGKQITWGQIISQFYNSCKQIEVIVVNSSKQSQKLNYKEHKHGYRVIVVGGLALSRGLTLEGLSCSYFYRNTSTYDVLMQMGRWFGYRDGYETLCRIFLTEETYNFYKEICRALEKLKRDIKLMGLHNKKPVDYGIRVRDSEELNITARNKMRNTKIKIYHHDFRGCLYETPYLYSDFDTMKNNIDATLNLMEQLDPKDRKSEYAYPFFTNVPVQLVKELLSNITVHDANINFDTKQILNFMNMREDINKFNILFMGGSGALVDFKSKDSKNIIKYKSVARNFDLRNSNTIVRMSSMRAHLWGPSDPSYGLTEEQKENVAVKHPDRSPSATMYLNEYENPLLIIYFVTPVCASKNDINTSEGYFIRQLMTKPEKYRMLVGYAIGFPKKESDSESESAETYVVNAKVNYFDKIHDEDEEEAQEI